MKPLLTLLRVMALLCGTSPVFAQPVISSISPAAATPGQSITLSGSGFNTTATANLVYFGAVRATVQSATATSLQVQVPVGASYGPVHVWNTGTGLWGASDLPFAPGYSGPRGGVLNIDFPTPTILDNGVGANAVCVADLNGDGKPEVVKGQDLNNSLILYVNGSTPGQLTFFDGPTITLPAISDNILGIRAADLNADGRMDLVAIGDIEVLVLINNSVDGGFTYTITLQTIPANVGGVPSPSDLEIADFNGDGKPDLALAAREANVESTLRVWNNTSSGPTVSFSEAGRYTMPGAQLGGRIAVGDIDGDGRPDLVHTNTSKGFQLLRNISTGGATGFAARQDLGTGIFYDVAIADMTGDGKRDVVTLSSGTNVENAYVFANQSTVGNISFAPPAGFANGGQAFAMNIALADLDADGRADVGYSNPWGNSLYFAKNAGEGGQARIAPFQTIDAGAVAHMLVFNDMDGDQRPDMVYTSGNTVQVRLQQPALAPKINNLSSTGAKPGDNITITGTGFSPTLTQNQVRFGATWARVLSASATSLQVTVPNAASMQPVQVLRKSHKLYGQSAQYFVPGAAAVRQTLLPTDFASSDINLGGSRATDGTIIDLDGDRRPEVVVLENNALTPVSILKNILDENDEPALATKISFGLGSYSYRRLRLADLDGDSLPDICALRDGGLIIRRNISTPGNIDFGGAIFYNLLTGGGDLEVVDADGDGRLDLVVTPNIFTTGDVQLLLNQTVGNSIGLLPPLDLGFNSAYNDLASGDLNNDGRPELVLTSFDGTITVLGNQSLPGTPIFTLALQTGTYNRLFGAGIGDIDGDGKNDVVTCYDGYDAPNVSAAVLRNTGIGSGFGLASPQTVAGNDTYSHLMLADLSGDGLPEIVLGSTSAFTLLLRNNSQPGQIATTTTAFSLINRPGITISGDVDVDGRTDFVQLSTQQSAQKLFLNKPQFDNEFRLASLAPSTGNISPAFNSNTIAYTMAVATTTSSIQFTAVPVSNLATMRIRINNGAYVALASGALSPVLNLNPGNNTVDVEVKAESGALYTYRVTVRRSRAVLQTSAERSSVCIGSSVRFVATVTNPGVQSSFRWYRNGQLVPDSNAATFTVASFGKTDQVQCQYVYKESGDTTTFTLTGQLFGLKDVFEIAVFVDRNETSDFFDPANWLDYKVPGPNTHVIIPATNTPFLLVPQIWWGVNITIASLQIGANSGIFNRGQITITGNCPVLPD